MTKYLLPAASMAFALVSSPIGAAFPTGYDLYRDCGSTDYGNQMFCLGFLAGVWTTAESSNRFCHNGTFVHGQMQLLFLDWARRNPGLLDLDEGTAALLSFVNAFPCRPALPPTGR